MVDWNLRFKNIYKPLLKEGYDEFEAALRSEKSRHIRINSCRGIDYLGELDFCEIQAAEGLTGVYRIILEGEKEKLTDSLSFQTGGIYIMNPSSVVPAKILASLMPDMPLILDVSAAPGGKTCAISDYINRSGLIIANEVSPSRLKSLHFNLEKYGCYNVKTISRDGRLLQKFFPAAFDGILLDAPCSNENKIFRNKTVQKCWNDELVSRMAALQRSLITSAFECLKPGGVLVYSTCTLNVEENEDVVKFLISNQSDASLLHIDGFSGGGFSGVSEIDEKVVRIMPSAKDMDGFFVAVFRKNGETSGDKKIKQTKLTEKQTRFFIDNFPELTEHPNIIEAEGRGYITSAYDPFPKIHFQRRGLNVYRLAKDRLEPTCQAVWELGAAITHDKRTIISRNYALEYLKGFDIPASNNYNTQLLFCGSSPVGYGKLHEDNIKNKLDRYFLFGKNIEW